MLKQKFIIQFGSNIGIKLFGMIAGIFVARIAGPDVIGTLAYGMAYASIFAIIMGLFGTPHIKFISEGRPIDRCLGTYSKLLAGSIGLYLIITASWLLFQKHVLGHQFENPDVEKVIWIFLFIKVFDKIVIASEGTFLAKLKQAKSNIPQIIRQLIYHPGRILIVFLGYKAVTLASWNLFTTLLILPIVIKLLREFKWGKFDKKLAIEYVKIAIPLSLYMILGVLVSQGDKLILKYYSNTTELGYYTAALSIGGLVILIGNSVGQIFFPLFSSYLAKNDWISVNDKITKYHNFIVIFILPFLLCLSLVAEPLITFLLGERYVESIIPFSILIIATFSTIWFTPYMSIITGNGKFYLYAGLTGLKLVFFMVSIFILINPAYLGLGATGLAINYLVVTTFEGIVFFIASKKIGKIKINKNNLIMIIIIFSFSVFFFWTTPFFRELSSYWMFLITFSFLISTYLVLFIFKLTGIKYILTTIDAFSPKLISGYVKDELSNNNK
ncbi:MAG: oligosaccharide flippase family protein [Bacteroidales bacterium]|nr:oligosaccharide flippase family protein [Bacteroidales bacterium]